MSNVSIYKFENKAEIRVVEIEGNPWFVALDVCRALDVYTYGSTVNTTMAVKKLAADEYRKEEGLNRIEGFDPRAKTVVLVSESGLYKLIMRSDKPEARRFQDWVTRDVLPAIRKMLEELYGKGGLLSFEGIYLDAYGREKPCFHLPRREIAELTGKRHCDVTRDTRNMLAALGDDANLRHVRRAFAQF